MSHAKRVEVKPEAVPREPSTVESLDSLKVPPAQNSQLWGGELKLINPRESSLPAATVIKLNDELASAWATGNNSLWTLVRVRAEILQETRQEFSLRIETDPSTLRDAEGSFRAVDSGPPIITRILNAWRTIAQAPETKPEIASSLHEGIENILNNIAQSCPNPVGRLLRRWKCEIGAEKFRERARISDQSLKKVEEDKVLYSFSQLTSIAYECGIIPISKSITDLRHDPEMMRIREAWVDNAIRVGAPPEIALIRMHLQLCGFNFLNHKLLGAVDLQIDSTIQHHIDMLTEIPLVSLKPVIKFLTSDEAGLTKQEKAELTLACRTAAKRMGASAGLVPKESDFERETKALIESLTSLTRIDPLLNICFEQIQKENELYCAAFYGDVNGVPGSSHRMEVFRLRAQLGFHSVSDHPKDRKNGFYTILNFNELASGTSTHDTSSAHAAEEDDATPVPQKISAHGKPRRGSKH